MVLHSGIPVYSQKTNGRAPCQYRERRAPGIHCWRRNGWSCRLQSQRSFKIITEMLLVFIIYNQHFDRFWFQKSGHIRNDFVWNLDDGRVAFYLFGIVLCNDLTVGIGLAVKTALKGFGQKMRRTSGIASGFWKYSFAVHIVDFTAVKRNHKTALFVKPSSFACMIALARGRPVEITIWCPAARASSIAWQLPAEKSFRR